MNRFFHRNQEINTRENEDSLRRGNIYALLISVGNYEHREIANLESSHMDLVLMIQALQNGLKVPSDNIRIIGENGTTTINNLAHAMKDFSRMLQNNDTFLFYFSDHGRNGELLFSDLAIELQSVINYIEKLPAKNKILILDCCFAGSFSEMAPKEISLEDTLESFTGSGIAVLASSSANELSRLGPGEEHSLFTGMVSTAFSSRQLIRQGKLSLSSVVEYIRKLMDTWNQQHPDQSQQPIIRTSIGGTIYFDVEDYHPYETRKVSFETDDYIVHSVKPLSSSQEKRLSAFVIPKKENFMEKIPAITKDIVQKIRYENIFYSRKSENLFKNESAKAIWCYFGKDESDIINSLHCAYSIWACDQKTAQKYYHVNSHSHIKEGIYIFINSSYDILRAMRDDNITSEEYENDVEELFYKIMNRAEQFISCMTETFNHTKTLESAQREFQPWIKDVFGLFIRMSDAPISPDDIHAWAEEVLSLAGWVIDMILPLQNSKGAQSLDERNKWLFQNAVRQYYDSLERIKEIERSERDKKLCT